MKDTIFVLLGAFGGIAGLFLFIKMVYYSIKNDLKNDSEKKEINTRIKELEQKHYNGVASKETRYDDVVHNKVFSNNSLKP